MDVVLIERLRVAAARKKISKDGMREGSSMCFAVWSGENPYRRLDLLRQAILRRKCTL